MLLVKLWCRDGRYWARVARPGRPTVDVWSLDPRDRMALVRRVCDAA